MPGFLHAGWFEMFLPIRLGAEPRALRVWIEMRDLVPLLRQLDHVYGSEAEPYCVDPTRVRAAQDTLAGLIVQAIAAHQGTLRRVWAPADVAEWLTAEYAVRRVNLPMAIPAWLNQVDLEPADVAPLLSRLYAPDAAEVIGPR
jgi:hypothetical protein